MNLLPQLGLLLSQLQRCLHSLPHVPRPSVHLLPSFSQWRLCGLWLGPWQGLPGSFLAHSPRLASKVLSKKDKAICHPLVVRGKHQANATRPARQQPPSPRGLSTSPGRFNPRRKMVERLLTHAVSRMSPWESLAGRWEVIEKG